MAIIDDKVVAMSFENRKFESGVKQSMTSIDNLKKSLEFKNAGKGLESISTAAAKVTLGHIASDLDTIKNKFSALSVAALAVFSSIAIKAVQTGAQLVKSLTLQPVLTGFQEYSTNLNAIQTILANTQASGATLDDVNAALQDLNKYSDQTIYNFSQMARNIGTFTAAGVDLKTSTASIKGIANLAALSGSNADQASTAMYQLSQAISSGRVGLQDWNSVVNAGMGGTVFQRALAQTAEAMGTIKKGAVQLEGPMKNVKINGESFRESIGGQGPKWLTSKVLTATLQQFTGDLTDAELAAQGFTDSQIQAIQQTAQTAQHAATEVKTITQVFDVAKETAGSGWAQTFQIIFGNFSEAKETFTALSNTINGFINQNAAARNKVLADWKALGGRTQLIEGIKTAFKALGEILKPIKDAFRDIFPAKTGRDLYNFTITFKNLAEAMRPSPQTIDNLRRTFRGLFALLDIGKQILGGVFNFFKRLFSSVGGGQGGFLSLTASIGDFLVSIDEALKKGDGINKFFVKMGDIVAVPINILKELGKVIANLFTGFFSGGFSGQIDGMTKAMTPFQKALRFTTDLWHKFLDSFSNSDVIFQKVADGFVEFAQTIGPALTNALTHMNFEAILQVIRTGLLVGLFVMFRKFLGKGAFSDQLGKVLNNTFRNLGGGITKNLNNSLKAFTGNMQAMQQNLKSKTLLNIAIAIGILAASVVALSLIDPKRLNSAMTALGLMFAGLLGAMKIMDKYIAAKGPHKLVLVAGSLILLAVAIDLLTIAVFALSRMDWEELKKGLGGVAALLITLTAVAKPLGAGAPGLIRAGVGITAIAVGLNIMALAVKQFGNMDLHQLAKGLGAVAASLVIVGLATQAMPKTMALQGAGLILVATGLNIMGKAVEKFGDMDWNVIKKGLLAIAGALVAIAVGMNLMPLSLPLTAAGLILVSISLGKITKAVGVMGRLSIKELAKGIIGLGAALGVLAGGLYLMTGTLSGAAALTVAAAGIAILVPALTTLGKQSWNTILKSLVALGAAFVVLGVAGLALAPVAPALLAVGAALLLIGGGLALAGAGIALIGIGLSAIAVAGPTALGILVQAFNDFMDAIPKFVTSLVLGLLAMLDAFAKTAPKFVDAIVKITNSLLDGFIKVIPKLVVVIEKLIDAILKVFHDKQNKIIQAGFDLIIALLKGISNNIGPIIKQAGDIVVKFLKGVSGQLSKVITAGTNLIINLVTGIINAFGRVIAAGVTAAGKFLKGFAKQLVKLIDEGAQALIDFLNGVAKVIDKREPEIIKAFGNIGWAIIKGIIKGLGDHAGDLYDKVKEIGKKALDYAKHPWKIFSPSHAMEELGQNIIQGLINGIKDTSKVDKKFDELGKGLIKLFKDIFGISSPSKVMYDIGKSVTEGFAKGLKSGSSSNIRTAFHDLNTQLLEEIKNSKAIVAAHTVDLTKLTKARRQNATEIEKTTKIIKKNQDIINTSVADANFDQIRKSNEIIATQTDRLEKLQKARNKDAEAIEKTTAIISKHQNIVDKLTAGHNDLIHTFSDEKQELIDLAKGYTNIGNQLDTANQKLDDLKQQRKDAIQTFTEQYSTLPELDDPNSRFSLIAYEGAIKNQIRAVKTYKSTLDKLRKLGLDDTTYQRLLNEGTVDQTFATQILQGGKDAVKELNGLDSQLLKVSKGFATDAANNLYNSGIEIAQGLVDGLKDSRKEIQKVMNEIADGMVNHMNKSLGMKSPSKVFMEIGQNIVKGLTTGIDQNASDAHSSVDNMSKSLIKSMNNISFDDEMNLEPVITPVLDLSAVQNGANKMAGIIDKNPLGIVSFGQAAIISTKQSSTSQNEDTTGVPGGTSIHYEQNNYSPKALSEVDIYRQTRNQLSRFKTVQAPA